MKITPHSLATCRQTGRTVSPAAIVVQASIALICGCAHTGAGRRELDQLFESERAFCRLAQETSIRDAFLNYLDAEGVVFRPGPVNGQTAYASRPASAAGLSWELSSTS